MLRCRILYGAALLGALVFQICYTEYFSWYIWLLALCFPVLSLLLSLPGMLGCRVTLRAPLTEVVRGGKAFVTAALVNRTALPVSWLRLEIQMTNRMTGEGERVLVKATGISQGGEWPVRLNTEHCGLITCRGKGRVYDLLGLFSMRLRFPGEAQVLCLPKEQPPEAAPQLAGAIQTDTVLRPRPGGGPAEDYDLREYRAGDSMRAVHWKLSSKLDELVVRESLEPDPVPVVLTFNHFGPPEILDRTYDRLSAVSRFLQEEKHAHMIQWADPETGELHSWEIGDGPSFGRFLRESLSAPAPADGRSVLEKPVRVEGTGRKIHHLHVEPDAPEQGAEA